MEALSRFISPRLPGMDPNTPRVSYWLLIILVLMLLSFAVSFFEDSVPVTSSDGAAAIAENARKSRIYTVTFRFGVFSPTNLRIHSGDTVTFRNEDARGIRVVAQSDPRTQRPSFDSIGEIPTASSYSVTFAEPGIYAYYNADDERQTGVIIVRE